MVILLDIDGVLVTTPSWRKVELLADGFMKFNEKAASNLAHILKQTNASIVLTTTHRITYSVDEWIVLLKTRGIHSPTISKINNVESIAEMADRATEISIWVAKKGFTERFVIIDDDLSINGLPPEIKKRCVLTKPMIGLDTEATENALAILMHSQKSDK
ncbi:hypothetical protein GCM10022409_04810 [Hymenobacter glaciei]|uniref:FCP1 homology domain-containing protein n=1 Tax=Hymenobacter glaciei TaxID=877209 RepID=A0ABP7TBP6_9BACT